MYFLQRTYSIRDFYHVKSRDLFVYLWSIA